MRGYLFAEPENIRDLLNLRFANGVINQCVQNVALRRFWKPNNKIRVGQIIGVRRRQTDLLGTLLSSFPNIRSITIQLPASRLTDENKEILGLALDLRERALSAPKALNICLQSEGSKNSLHKIPLEMTANVSLKHLDKYSESLCHSHLSTSSLTRAADGFTQARTRREWELIQAMLFEF